MNIKFKKTVQDSKNITILLNSVELLPTNILKKEEINYIKKSNAKENFFHFNRLSEHIFVCLFSKECSDIGKHYEELRTLGDKTVVAANAEKIEDLVLYVIGFKSEEALAFIEGIILGNYVFDKYKSKKENILKKLFIVSKNITELEIKNLQIVTDAVYQARNWVNEPGSVLTPISFAKQITELFSNLNEVKVDVFSERKITSLKMNGILNVNKGSIEQPAFIELRYIPEKLKTVAPLVLVGKGVFFDTGGVNIKPSKDMLHMKCDMAGAASVAATVFALAKLKTNIPVVGLIPAVENRPGGNAFLPGDIITMMNGKTVEVQNTDAEGRLILADALCYAKKFNPRTVISIATLTGSAHATLSHYGFPGMHIKADDDFELLKKTSFEIYERIVEFPMWKEYNSLLESDVADIKNTGGKYAGAIVAAKFLGEFAEFPFIHLDIAGAGFIKKREKYKPQGGTGVGVRLFVVFLNKLAQNLKK